MRIRRRRSSARSLPRKSTRPPARSLPGTTATSWQDPCRDPGKTLAEGRGQARTCQDSTAVPMQLPAQPARRAPAWRHATSRPTQQAPAWWHADLHEGPTTAPPQLPACLPTWSRTHRWPGHVSKPGEAATDRTGPVPAPDKAKGHLRDALNASCPVIRGITTQHCRPFHLLCATVATLFPIKGGPRRLGEGFGISELVTPCS